jgi:hypothetical protein
VAGHELAHPGEHGAAVAHSAAEYHEAEHEEVYSPDQLKPPPFRRLITLATVLTIIVLPLMAFFGNHKGNVEKVILVGIAGLILVGGIGAYFLKKAGLRN